MDRKNLIFLGDSITDCDRLWDTGPELLGSGYVRILREKLPQERYHIENHGHNGYTAWQVKQRLAEDCLERRPDMVSVLVGINDVHARLWGAGGYDAQEYGQILEEMIASVQDHTRAAIILMEPFAFPWPEEMKNWFPVLTEFCRAAEQAARRTGVVWLPLREMWERRWEAEGVKKLTVDGIHLTPRGHQILAATWLENVTNKGNIV